MLLASLGRNKMAVNTDPPVQLQGGTDSSQKDAFINENFRKLSDSLNPFQISDGTTNILNIGQDSTGAYSMKVAKPGYNAFDAPDDQLIFNSNQNVLKIVKSGTAVLSFNFPSLGVGTGGLVGESGGSQLTIPHGLGYVPVVSVYANQFSSGEVYVPISSGSIASFALNNFPQIVLGTASQTSTIYAYSIAADNTNLYIDIFRSYARNASTVDGISGTIDIKYYLFQETAN